jgi:CelD/BcsL family acetyltransferase involved in cellulose biosynthesis
VSVVTPSTGLTFEEISTDEEFAALGDSWNDLVRAMPRPSPYLLHQWLLTWWRHYGVGNELAVHVAYRGHELVGALPLCVRRRRGLRVLSFLGAEQIPLADLLLAEDEDAEVGAELAKRGASTQHDFADFHGLPSPSRFVAALGPSRLELIVRAEAPVLELNGSEWEDVYRTRLSSKHRSLHRRRCRQLARLGTIETTVARTRDELAPALEDAFELHALRWSGRPDGSEFGTPRGKAFHREATSALAELDDVVRIVTLKLDGRPIAFVYYLVLEGTMYCYRLAFDPEFQRFSPGLVNRYDSLENAFAEGVTRVEFLGGMERYKMELADRTEPLFEGLGLPHGLAGRLVVSGQLNGIRLRRYVKRSSAIRHFYYEGLAPARRLFRIRAGS